MSTIFQIDRSQPFSFEKLGAGEFATQFTIESEDPAAVTLAEIDVAKIEIVPLVDSTEEHPVHINEKLAEKVAELKGKGYVFLDAKVLVALLASPEVIPAGWHALAESESIGTAAIEFRGTTFVLEGTTESHMLTLNSDRGVWRFGHDSLLFTKKDLESFSKDSWGRILRYVAVYKPQ